MHTHDTLEAARDCARLAHAEPPSSPDRESVALSALVDSLEIEGLDSEAAEARALVLVEEVLAGKHATPAR